MSHFRKNSAKHLVFFTLLLLLGFNLAPPAMADLIYSGRITDDSGLPMSGTTDLQIQFFRKASGGSAIIDPLTFGQTKLAQGIFTVTINLPPKDLSKVFSGEDVWIEVQDLTNGRTFPRQKFGSVPYAARMSVDPSVLEFDDHGQLTIRTSAESAANLVSTINQASGTTLSDSVIPAPGGDVSGTLSNLSVDKISGEAIDLSQGGGDLIKWNGTESRWERGTVLGTGDMLASTYDSGANGVVDDAEDAQLLNGENAAYYRNATNINSGTLNDARISAGIARIGDIPTTTDGLTEGTTNLYMSSAEQAKLTGIEPLADVTDATNVAAAGAVMHSNFGNNGILTRTSPGVYSFTPDNSSNWDTAHGWGDHGAAGYLSSVPWATPGAIGSTTPETGSFTTLNATTFTSNGIDDNAAATALTIAASGDIGIGTTSPDYSLHVAKEGSTTIQNQRSTDDTNGAIIRVTKTRGTIGLPTTVVDGDSIGHFGFNAHDGTSEITRANIQGLVNGAVSTGVVPTDLVFNTGTNSATEKMRIDSSGNVGIGSDTPGAKLDIAGQIMIQGGSPGAGKVLTSTDGSGIATWESLPGGGDMLKATYDSGDNGVVDDAEDAQLLNGENGAYYLNATNITAGTLNDDRISAGIARVGDIPTTTDGLTEGTTNLYMSSAEQSKLTGIEPLADVTDTANVAAAGAVMHTDFGNDGILTRTSAGVYGFTADNSANWNTAHSWGDHGAAGYLSSVTWATPGTIGSSIPSSGTFTSLNATTFTSTGIDDNAVATSITIDGAGKIGIGSSSPNANLDVAGTIKATGAIGNRGTNIGQQMELGTSAFTTLRFDADAFRIFAGGAGGSSELVRILEGGQFGIGTDTPASALDVYTQDTGIDRGIISRQSSDSIHGAALTLFKERTTGTAALANDYSGIVTYRFYNSTSTDKTAAAIQSQIVDPTNASEDANLQFLTMNNGTTGEKMRIESNGNVGISTESPDEKLHVEGSIKMVDGNQQAGRVLTSDADGVASWQDPGGTKPRFRAHLNGSNQAISDITWTAVNWTTEDYDDTNAFDPATDRFTPQTAGTYLVVFNVFINASSADIITCRILKNGVSEIYGGQGTGEYGAAGVCTGLIEMNGTTDYLQSQVYIADDNSTIHGGRAQTFFQAIKL